MSQGTDKIQSKETKLYHSLSRSSESDILEGKYQIHLDRPVNELSNKFCRYYFATDVKTKREYFAIVFEREFNVQVEELSILKNSKCPAINPLIAFSLVKLSVSKKYALCAIVESYDPSETLENYVENYGEMSNDQIENELMPAVNTALSFCESHKINCSNINPKNILVSDEGVIKIREFFVALPSYYQDDSFLAPEIADAMPSGRKIYGLSADIYALGVTVYYALTGVVPKYSKHEPELFNSSRIESGTYECLTAKKRISRKSRALVAWTLRDNFEDRWTIHELIEWQTHGEDFKLPRPKSSNQYTTLFSSHNYSAPRALASAMYVLYQEGVDFCHTDTFLKWIQKVKGKTEYVEEFFHMHTQTQAIKTMSRDEIEDAFLKILLQLDNNNICIRLRDVCFTIDSLPNVIFEAIVNENDLLFDKIEKLFSKNFYGIISMKNTNRILPNEYVEKLSNAAKKYEKSLSREDLCIIIHQFDKYVPCLSNSVKDNYALSLQDLLEALDRMATDTPSTLNVDENLIAFIRSKIKITESDWKNIQSIENMAKSTKLLKGVSFLAIAQENASNVKIPHLCSVIAGKLIEWIGENINNSKLKNVMTSEMAELAGAGILSQMLYVVSNPKLFLNDNKGYKAAHKEMSELSERINRLSDENIMYLDGIDVGQRVTVLISYLLCMIVALILIT